MKKKNKLLLVFTGMILVLATIFGLVACKADGGSGNYNGKDFGSESSNDAGKKSSIVVTTDRLIVYTVEMSLTSKDVNASMKKMQEKAKEIGGWQASSSENETYIYVTFRVPTVKLDEFIDRVSEGNEVRNKRVSTVDITDQYQTAETKRAELIKEKDRLTAWMETDASLTTENKIEIQKRITEIANEIDGYSTEISGYKKQADYSTVNISLYQDGQYVEPSYWDRLGEVFFGSGKSIGTVFGWLFTAIVAILPYFAIVAGVFGLYVLIKFIVCRAKKIPFTLFKRAREHALVRKEQKRKMREEMEAYRAKRTASARPARPSSENEASEQTGESSSEPLSDEKEDKE